MFSRYPTEAEFHKDVSLSNEMISLGTLLMSNKLPAVGL
jgi:hypothetical protein